MQNLTNPHYAGFWVRVVASLIDTILLTAVILPILWGIYGPQYFDLHHLTRPNGNIDLLMNWVFPIVAILIFWFTKSATPGKMLLHLKIVDAQTLQKPTPGQFIIRYIGYYISAIPFCLGFFWIAFDKRKQGWHDKIAKTVVIYTK